MLPPPPRPRAARPRSGSEPEPTPGPAPTAPELELPEWAVAPPKEALGAAFVVRKGERVVSTVPLARHASRALVFGRNSSMSNVVLEHQSISRRHAALVWRAFEVDGGARGAAALSLIHI